MIEDSARQLLVGAQALWPAQIQRLSTQTQILMLVGLVTAFTHVLHALLAPRRAAWPLIGSRSLFEPRWLLGLRFTSHGRIFLREGYKKHKNDIFRVQCNTLEIALLPRRYVDELRALPEEKLSSPQALFKKSNGPYTGLGIILESHLHFEAVQQHLTPNIANFLPLIKDELDFARQQELPACHDWESLEVHTTMARVIARISSRTFAGKMLARDDEWITISTTYPMNSFATTLALRMVPKLVHPLVAMLVPYYWRAQKNISDAKRIVGRIIEERRAAAIGDGSDKDEPADLLQWMMDEAAYPHSQTEKLAHRLLFVSKASVMTTSLLISHCLFDLCAHPEHLEIVREEVLAVLREDGGFQKSTLAKMRKLDSALKESQRLNPAFLMTFDRIVKERLVLSDGTELPVGTHIAMPTDPMLRDAELVPPGTHPDSFDPFRFSRAREDMSQPTNAQRFQLASTDATSLPFGHGRHACPGRFFASSEAKLIIAHLLLLYDFRYPEGKTRPDNWLFAENLAPHPNARLLIRERKVAEGDLKLLDA